MNALFRFLEILVYVRMKKKNILVAFTKEMKKI